MPLLSFYIHYGPIDIPSTCHLLKTSDLRIHHEISFLHTHLNLTVLYSSETPANAWSWLLVRSSRARLQSFEGHGVSLPILTTLAILLPL